MFDENNWTLGHSFNCRFGGDKFRIAIFVDPECPWCKRFFQEVVPKINELTMEVFLCPVLGENSFDLSEAILETNDPAKALMNWFLNEEKPPRRTSDASNGIRKLLDKNVSLSEKVAVQTVPAIFLENGKGPLGFMTAMELISQIEQSY